MTLDINSLLTSFYLHSSLPIDPHTVPISYLPDNLNNCNLKQKFLWACRENLTTYLSRLERSDRPGFLRVIGDPEVISRLAENNHMEWLKERLDGVDPNELPFVFNKDRSLYAFVNYSLSTIEKRQAQAAWVVAKFDLMPLGGVAYILEKSKAARVLADNGQVDYLVNKIDQMDDKQASAIFKDRQNEYAFVKNGKEAWLNQKQEGIRVRTAAKIALGVADAPAAP